MSLQKFLVFVTLGLVFSVTQVGFSAPSAAPKAISEAELLQLSGLDLKTIIAETEKSLELELFEAEAGRSCGLKYFYVEGYESNNNLLKEALDNFSVITEVYGPIYLCQGYDYYLCSTQWKKSQDQKWSVTETECEQ